MPAIPAVGTTYDGAGFNNLEARFLERGKLRTLLVRDARGAATDISPHTSAGAINWSPFATDGTWRGDLMAFQRVNGAWGFNPNPNEGFHIAGAFREGNGPMAKPKIKSDDFMIVQSNFPFDTDTVEEGEPFSFTAVETAKPVIRRLRNNLPLNAANGSVLVESPGLPNSGWGRPLNASNVDRQVLLVSEFKKGGLPVYTVDAYALAKLTDIGNSKKDKKDSEAAELTYQPLPDGFFSAMIDGVYRPILKWTWVGGTGWTAMNTSATGTWLVTLGAQTTGTFTLTFLGNTTTAITAGAALPTAATVKSALVALDDGFTASNWTVTGSNGGPFTVVTPGAQYGALTGSGAALGTPGTFVIAPV